jgi:hypothetical protein
LGKPLSYFNWEESVKRTVYGLANTLNINGEEGDRGEVVLAREEGV